MLGQIRICHRHSLKCRMAEHALWLMMFWFIVQKFLSKMKILIVLLGLIIVLILFREQWLMLIGNLLIIRDTLQPADVIHTIAGDDYRTDYAIQLYEHGYGKTLFFTGGWCQYHLYNHGEHAQGRAAGQGVPVDAIDFDESKVTSTYMEAELLKEWIKRQPYPVRSIIVVSDPFHMRRARWIYRIVFGDQIQIKMAPIPFELTPYQHTWWKDWRSWRYVQDECLKYVYYLFRYRFSSGKFREWLASLDRE